MRRTRSSTRRCEPVRADRMQALPLEVYERLTDLVGPRVLQAVARDHYRACNRRAVQLTPAVVVCNGRLSWRACVLAGRRGSPDWLSVPFGSTTRSGRREAARLLRFAAHLTQTDTAGMCVQDSDAAIVSAMLAALRRTSVLYAKIRQGPPTASPLVLAGLRRVTIDWEGDPPKMPALPPGLQELRIGRADLSTIQLPKSLRLLIVFDPWSCDAAHLAAQLRTTPALTTLYLSIRLTTVAELGAIVDSARAIDGLRCFGVENAPVMWSRCDESLDLLAPLVPRLHELILRRCHLRDVARLPLATLRRVDLGYNLLLPAQLSGRAWPALERANTSGMGGQSIAAMLSAAPELTCLTVHEMCRGRPESGLERLGSAGIEALVRHPKLRKVDLAGASVEVSVVQVVLELSRSRTIDWLAITNCADRRVLLGALPDAPREPSPLHTLDLRYHGGVPHGLDRLLPALPALARLHLSLSGPPGDKLWAAIGKSTVRHLTIWGDPGELPPLPGVAVRVRVPERRA
jgi:hypothetical protein